jgi:hypothetical protein
VVTWREGGCHVSTKVCGRLMWLDTSDWRRDAAMRCVVKEACGKWERSLTLRPRGCKLGEA